MSRGACLPPACVKLTRIPPFDEFFETSRQLMEQIVLNNNRLDDMTKDVRTVGQALRPAAPTDSAPVPLGSLRVSGSATVSVVVERDGTAVPSKLLDKVARSYLGSVETKAKLLNKRIKDVRKLPGLEKAEFQTLPDRPHRLGLVVDEHSLKELASTDEVENIQRSLTKFNDRADILVIYLNGPIELNDALVAIVDAVKAELESKKLPFQLSMDGFRPKLECDHKLDDSLSSLVLRGWNLLQSIADFIDALQQDLPQLSERVEKAIAEANEIPAQLKHEAQKHNLSAAELLKAGRAISANIKVLTKAKQVVQQLGKTLQARSEQLAGGVTVYASSESRYSGALNPDSSGEGE